MESRYYLESFKNLKVISTHLNKSGFAPETGSELFVRNIPTDASELDVLRFFEEAGNILQVKLMMAENGLENRGFGYVTFINRSAARRAHNILSQRLFKNKTKLKIEDSSNNCRIFLGGLPTNKSKDQVWQELFKNGVKNIVDVIMYRSYSNRAQNRGFVFVEFQTHIQAADFREKHTKNLRLWGRPVVIDWSVPIPSVDEEVLNNVKVIFLRNLNVWETPLELEKKMKLLAGKTLERVYKFKDYAFIHLYSREDAEIMKRKLEEFYSGTSVEVEWSKPPGKHTTSQYRQQQVCSMSRDQSPETFQHYQPESSDQSCLVEKDRLYTSEEVETIIKRLMESKINPSMYNSSESSGNSSLTRSEHEQQGDFPIGIWNNDYDPIEEYQATLSSLYK